MLTITQLAKKFAISRSTILYYEREGLLLPFCRADNGYRQYGKKETIRLESILSYRSFGIPVQDIAPLLTGQCQQSREQILREQFVSLDSEIKKLRKQQTAIVAILKEPSLLNSDLVTKERWSEVMTASGFSDEDAHNWHKQFEKMEPEGHQKFLESLGIEEEEIKQIRKWSTES